MDFGWPINEVLQYDSREQISELESIMAVFVLIRGHILYNL